MSPNSPLGGSQKQYSRGLVLLAAGKRGILASPLHTLILSPIQCGSFLSSFYEIWSETACDKNTSEHYVDIGVRWLEAGRRLDFEMFLRAINCCLWIAISRPSIATLHIIYKFFWTTLFVILCSLVASRVHRWHLAHRADRESKPLGDKRRYQKPSQSEAYRLDPWIETRRHRMR
jgi:hypothetical protein